MATKPDPAVKVFEQGKRGIQAVYRALIDDDPTIQLAAARVAREAAAQLPQVIDEELRRAGTAHRRALARALLEPSAEGGEFAGVT